MCGRAMAIVSNAILSKSGARMQMKRTLMISLKKFQVQDLIVYSTVMVDI